MSKRGMSPLIATVLLIAFAVSIGAVIMSYGNAYYSEEQSGNEDTDTFCRRVNLDIYQIDGVPQLCIGNTDGKNVLSFILVNKGSIDIDSVHMIASLKGETNTVQTIDIEDSAIATGFPLEKEVFIDTASGDLVQIQFIAEVISGSQINKCFIDPVPTTSIRMC